MLATRPVARHLRCSSLSHTYDGKKVSGHSMEKVFCRVPQPFNPESKSETCGTSWLNHSLVAAVAMAESKIFFADR